MKSMVKFSLGDGNREIIESRVEGSDDVRDKIARGFKEGMGYESNLCYLRFLPSESGVSIFEIYPLRNDDELDKEFIGNLCREQVMKLYYRLGKIMEGYPKGVEPVNLP